MELPVDAVKSLLSMLEKRENSFEEALSELPADKQEAFRRRYRNLQNFLGQAIELNAPILASL